MAEIGRQGARLKRPSLAKLTGTQTTSTTPTPEPVGGTGRKAFTIMVSSGMGARHSGSVADWVCYQLAEKQYLQEAAYHRDGVLFYARFRDDILVILGHWKHGKTCFS